MSRSAIKVTPEMGARIKEERERINKTQDEMGGLLYMDGKNYARIERAQQGTRLSVFKDMARIFGCDLEYLLDKQPYRTPQEGFWAAMNEATERSKKAKENNEPWIEYAIAHGNTVSITVSCNKQSVPDLIEDIARNGGYELILEGLRRLAKDIDTSHEIMTF